MANKRTFKKLEDLGEERADILRENSKMKVQIKRIKKVKRKNKVLQQKNDKLVEDQ